MATASMTTASPSQFTHRESRPRTIHGSTIHGELANTSRVGRLLEASPLPLEKIRRILRAKRMRSIAVAPLAAESGISRPMLSMIIGDNALPGLDTLCLLLAWDEQFDEPVWEYMIERGQALRKANLAVMASTPMASTPMATTSEAESTLAR